MSILLEVMAMFKKGKIRIHSQGIVGLELFQQVIHVRRLDNWKKKEAVVRTVNAGLGVYLRFR